MTGYDQEMRADATRTVCFDGKPLVSATGLCVQCSGVILHKPIIPPQEVESDLAKGTDLPFLFRTHKEPAGFIWPCIQTSLNDKEEASMTHSIVC